MKFFVCLFVALLTLSCNLKKPLEIEPIVVTFPDGNNYAPSQVQFSSEIENIASYRWDFGDASPVNLESSPVHTYHLGGEYIVTLTLEKNNGETKTFTYPVTIKTITFQKSYFSDAKEVGKIVLPLSDGGFLVCAETANGPSGKQDITVLRLDKFGKEILRKSFGTDVDDFAYSMIKTSVNDYIICGTKSGETDRQVLVIRFDNSLNQIWLRSHGDPGKVEIGKSICEISNGDFVICGQINSNTSESSANTYTLRINSSGAIVAQNGAFGAENGYDIAHEVLYTTDAHLILTGQTDLLAPNYDQIFIAKRTVDFSEDWAYFFGGIKTDIGLSIKETGDKGFIICLFRSKFTTHFTAKFTTLSKS